MPKFIKIGLISFSLSLLILAMRLLNGNIYETAKKIKGEIKLNYSDLSAIGLNNKKYIYEENKKYLDNVTSDYYHSMRLSYCIAKLIKICSDLGDNLKKELLLKEYLANVNDSQLTEEKLSLILSYYWRQTDFLLMPSYVINQSDISYELFILNKNYLIEELKNNYNFRKKMEIFNEK